jgi:hypothetical protein
MYEEPENPFLLPELPESVGEIQPFSAAVVLSAGALIAALALFGLFQGVHAGMSRAARGGEGEIAVTDAVSAQPPIPLPANTQWSTLNGPAMSSAPAAKTAQSAAPASQSAAESEAPETEDSGATQAAAPTPRQPQAEQPEAPPADQEQPPPAQQQQPSDSQTF